MHPYSQKLSLGNASWVYFCEGYTLPNKGSIAQHITQKHGDAIQFFLAKKYGKFVGHTPENKHQIIELLKVEVWKMTPSVQHFQGCPTVQHR